MQKFVMGLMILSSFSAHALSTEYSNLEDPKPLPRHIMSEAFSGNPDGTVTVKGPRLVRGNRSYPFGWGTDKEGVCHSMGYETYLNQSAIAKYDGNTSRAYVNVDGTYNTIKDAESNSINEITCFNGAYQTLVKPERIIENSDNTATIMKPRLVRGDRSYPFGWSNDKQSVCKSMGFTQVLEQSSFAYYDGNTSRAYVNYSGHYTEIKDAETNSINEITCHNGANTTVVIDVNGNTYLRRN